MPWVLWQLWLFIAPGLYKREKKVVLPFLFSATLLFYVGAAFCHWLIIPNAFPALLSIFGDDPLIVAWPSLEKQFELVLAMTLGLSFWAVHALDGLSYDSMFWLKKPVRPDGFAFSRLRPAGDLVASFKARARSLGKDGKLRVLIIGDSLTSDIRGGSSYGIDTCWFNPSRAPRNGDLKITYEISKLSELPGLLR